MSKNLLIVAGEASGDAHGAELVRRLLEREPGLHIAGLGGPKMAAAGVALMDDLTAHAVMGFAGLLDGLGHMFRAYRRINHRLSTERPDAIILIDFPDFNMMVARHAKRAGVPIIYYISPQLWAWRTGRIKTLAHLVRKMLVLFEFEKDFYERAGMNVAHVGHPLLDSMADKLDVTDRAAVRRSLGLPESGTLIGLLPGSRRKEVEYVFPILLRAAEIMQREESGLTFVAARAGSVDPAQFERIAARHRVAFKTIAGCSHDVMLASDLLLVCSGTATLEAGLLRTPMIATYHAPLLSYMIFGALVRPGPLALVNIVAGEQIVPEYYMIDAKPRRIAAAALELLHGGLDDMRSRLGVIREKLGQPGASARAADEILEII